MSQRVRKGEMFTKAVAAEEVAQFRGVFPFRRQVLASCVCLPALLRASYRNVRRIVKSLNEIIESTDAIIRLQC